MISRSIRATRAQPILPSVAIGNKWGSGFVRSGPIVLQNPFECLAHLGHQPRDRQVNRAISRVQISPVDHATQLEALIEQQVPGIQVAMHQAGRHRRADRPILVPELESRAAVPASAKRPPRFPRGWHRVACEETGIPNHGSLEGPCCPSRDQPGRPQHRHPRSATPGIARQSAETPSRSQSRAPAARAPRGQRPARPTP